ncbi:MAG: tubulin-like doman-containing protein, partial [Candidatus Eremiobacterota bacterium]
MDTPGSQADLIRIRPTILIGLGGTGGDVILRVRKRFYEKYGTLAEFPIVAYLWLDTDKSEKHILGKEVREFVRMTDTERLMLTINDTTVITQNLDEPGNAHIKKWWYPGLNALGQMNEGAGQIRAYSRLSFFYHYKAIRTAVTDANTRVRDPHAMERMMKSPLLKDQGIVAQVEFNQPTNVYLVSSIAGGTGSGLLLDMAFMIKELFQEGNVTLMSYLVFPDHFGTITNEKMKANAFALLKELNFYKYGVPFFEAEWALGNPSKVPIPPFDYCYVFDNQNASGQVTGGQPGSQELIFELLADSIFKDFSHGEFADHKRSARVNLRQYMNKTYEYAHPRFKQNFIQRYSSMGLSTIVVPHARIITACAYRLAADVVDLWSGQTKDGYNPADLPRFVREDFLSSARLLEDDSKKRHDLLFGLLDASGLADPDKGKNQGLLEELSRWSQETLRDVERGAMGPRQTVRDFLDERTREQEKRLWAEQVAPEPEKWGHFPRTIRANLEALFRRASEAIRGGAFRLVDERHDSLKHSEAVLNETVETLRSFITLFQKKSSDIQDVLQRRQKEANRRLQEVGRYQNRSNWDGRKGIIMEHVTERYLEALVGDNRTPGLLRCQLQDRVYKEGVELCHRLIAFIHGTERPDGRKGGGVVDQLAQLARDLEALKQELLGGYKYFSQKDHQPQALVLYEPTDIENKYYPAYVRSRPDVEATSKGVLARLERAITGLAADIAG